MRYAVNNNKKKKNKFKLGLAELLSVFPWLRRNSRIPKTDLNIRIIIINKNKNKILEVDFIYIFY